MKLFLLENNNNSICETVIQSLNKLNIPFEKLKLPEKHTDLIDIFKEKQGGVVFIPSIWDDLFSVKIIQELLFLNKPYEFVMVGDIPTPKDLVVAFNEGLTCFLETPSDEIKLDLIINRAKRKLNEKNEIFQLRDELDKLNEKSIPFERSRAMIERNSLLGKGFIEIYNKTGIFSEDNTNVLVVSPSTVQTKKISDIIKKIGINVTGADSIETAIKEVLSKKFAVIISDSVLHDGNVLDLSNGIKKITTKMPHIIVWSSSPEKATKFLKPENNIDEFIKKPSPNENCEYILTSVIENIYKFSPE